MMILAANYTIMNLKVQMNFLSTSQIHQEIPQENALGICFLDYVAISSTQFQEAQTMESNRIKKKRKIKSALDSVKSMYSEAKKMRAMIGENLSMMINLKFEMKTLPILVSQSNELSKPLNSERILSGNLTDSDKNKSMESENETDIAPLLKTMNGNYTKLKEIDNGADEERLGVDLAMPLSPPPILNFTEFVGVDPQLIKRQKENISFLLTSRPDYTDIHNEKTLNTKGNHSETDPELAGFVPNIISKQCGTDNGFWHPTSSTFCVICNSKDAGGVLKIFQAMGTIISKTSVISQSSYILEGILSAYSFRKDLSSMENASVLFSLLLNYGSGQLSANPGCSFSSKDACSWSLESELNAHSNLQTQFVEACKIDINSLVTLMENFLHHKEIYTYKTSKDNLGAIGYQFSKENPHISYGSASLIQLVAGSMILASICKLFKDISFLVKLSFQILRWTPQSNFSSVLVILHTFVSVCKESFFSAAENKMSTIVKSVVQHLELGQSSPDLQSAEILPTCKDCPFSQGALSLDELLLFLMIEMEQYPSNTSKLHSRKTECVSKKLENSENGYTSCLLQNKHVASEDCDDLWLQCDASCVRCSLIDDISLLELTMYYADWHWTFENIIPSLFKMVQSFHVEERYSSIVITLFGIFGRMGVDAFGYDHDQVVELRKQICTLLDSLDNGDGSRMSKASLGLEIRVVEAMLKLLPMSFKEICGIDLENQADKRLPSCVCTQSIRKWFSQLSEIQKNRCVVYTNFMPECWNYGWVRQSVFFAPVLKR